MRTRNEIEVRTRLLERRGDYGYDAPRQGLLPTAASSILYACLAAMHWRCGRSRLARIELAASTFLLLWFAMYLHTTRRGKFLAWADVLVEVPLRGNEQVRDMGCGRGAVLAMVAKLVPQRHVVGLDLWTEDQSGNRPETTRRNREAEGVNDRCELKTGDMLSMPFPADSFDLVVSSMAIHNIDEHNVRNHARRFQALNEAVRVLKPGGRLVIVDFWSGAYAASPRARHAQCSPAVAGVAVLVPSGPRGGVGRGDETRTPTRSRCAIACVSLASAKRPVRHDGITELS